jgi:hypothetical protein
MSTPKPHCRRSELAIETPMKPSPATVAAFVAGCGRDEKVVLERSLFELGVSSLQVESGRSRARLVTAGRY